MGKAPSGDLPMHVRTAQRAGAEARGGLHLEEGVPERCEVLSVHEVVFLVASAFQGAEDQGRVAGHLLQQACIVRAEALVLWPSLTHPPALHSSRNTPSLMLLCAQLVSTRSSTAFVPSPTESGW